MRLLVLVALTVIPLAAATDAAEATGRLQDSARHDHELALIAQPVYRVPRDARGNRVANPKRSAPEALLDDREVRMWHVTNPNHFASRW